MLEEIETDRNINVLRFLRPLAHITTDPLDLNPFAFCLGPCYRKCVGIEVQAIRSIAHLCELKRESPNRTAYVENGYVGPVTRAQSVFRVTLNESAGKFDTMTPVVRLPAPVFSELRELIRTTVARRRVVLEVYRSFVMQPAR
jgi:hypothetical protein